AATAALLFHLRALSPPSADSAEISHFVERDAWVWYLRWPLTHLAAQWIHRAFGLSGADSLALLSGIAGALFLITVGAVSRRSPLILIALLSATSLTLIGHVEVYAWPSLALLWLLLLGPMHLRGAVPLAPVVTLFGFGCLMHMLVAFYTPVLIWIAIAGRRRALERGAPREAVDADTRRALARGLLFLLIITLMPLAITAGGLNNDLERLVPLTTPEVPHSSNQVTLLSPGHLVAMGIFLALSCPIGLPLALIRIRRAWMSDAARTAAIAACCGLVFLVIWHPDMGWRGDWDLFSHPGLAINLLAWRVWERGTV
ncbi:hypothetical protein JXA47_17865, partial [Candidatus Sumerlaeota bacterium]|nr:hypothetical protein [Candidatus Sumerlaeota bacterium]